MANIRNARKKCRDECPGYISGTRNGDVRRCGHGVLYIADANPRAFDSFYWRRLTPFWHPFKYQRARTALAATDAA